MAASDLLFCGNYETLLAHLSHILRLLMPIPLLLMPIVLLLEPILLVLMLLVTGMKQVKFL